MEYSPTLCFAGFNSKRRKFQQERREKRAIAAAYVVTKFFVSGQTPKKIAKELCRDKRQRVETENGNNLTIQLRQRKFMLR